MQPLIVMLQSVAVKLVHVTMLLTQHGLVMVTVIHLTTTLIVLMVVTAASLLV